MGEPGSHLSAVLFFSIFSLWLTGRKLVIGYLSGHDSFPLHLEQNIFVALFEFIPKFRIRLNIEASHQ